MAATREVIQPPGMHVRRVGDQALYAHVVAVSGGTRQVFVAGQIARDGDGNTVGKGDMRAQLEQVCENVKTCLEAAGAGLADVVKTVTNVTDIDEYFKHTDVRMRYFGSSATSTTVEVSRLAGPDFTVEIEALAITG